MRRRLAAAGALAAVVGLAAFSAACSSGSGAGSSSTTVTVTLDEYSIKTNAATAPPGPVTFDVRNAGVEGHNLLIIRTALAPDSLPVHGSVASEEGSVGKTDVLAADDEGSLTVDLEPGVYVLICNVSDHYRAGMFGPFTVA